jgi:hypothetical protein
VEATSERYVSAYERLTGKPFHPNGTDRDAGVAR